MGTSENNQDKIIVGNCIYCDGLVRIPVSASPQSTVRCPHCGESFKLASVLDDSVPTLEIVEEPASQTSATAPRRINLDSSNQDPNREPGTKFEVSPILKKGAKKRRKKRRRSKEASEQEEKEPLGRSHVVSGQEIETGSKSAGDVESKGEHGGGNRSALISDWPGDAVGRDDSAPLIREADAMEGANRSRSKDDGGRVRREPPTRPKNRPRKKSDGGGFEMVKIILGAMLALPVAQLLVWWVFGQDPLDFGPGVGAVLPAVVPADLRGEGQDDATNETSNNDDAAANGNTRETGQLPRLRTGTNLDRISLDDE